MIIFRRTSLLAKKLQLYLRSCGIEVARSKGKVWPNELVCAETWPQWKDLTDRLEWLYKILEDQRSKDTLVRLLAYHLLGPERIKLPQPGGDRDWPEWRKTTDASGGATIDTGFLDLTVTHFDLTAAGFDLQVYTNDKHPHPLFELEQYADRSHGVFVRPGDVVIDGGACWGDSTLYFASLAGESGKVFAIEFLPSNLSIFRRNLEANPKVADRVTLIERALWSDSDHDFEVQENGPATRVSKIPKGASTNSDSCLIVPGLSIDDLVVKNRLNSVDFIKMDIEGAEPEALKGSLETVRNFRPRLALCVYHDPEHYVSLAEVIAGLGLGYRFSLRHHTDHAWETVLYCWVD